MSDRASPRKRAAAREQDRIAFERFTAPGELPDHPDNLDFLELPESFQTNVATRFQAGTALTRTRNKLARERWLQQVDLMLERRERAETARQKHKAAAEKARRANKASVGELAREHERARK